MEFHRELSNRITDIALVYLKDMPEVLKQVQELDKLDDQMKETLEQDNGEHERLSDLYNTESKKLQQNIYKVLLAIPTLWESIVQEIQESQVNEPGIIDELTDYVREGAKA